MGSFLAMFFMLQKGELQWEIIAFVFSFYFNGYLYTKYQHRREVLYKILTINIISFITLGSLLIINQTFELLYKWLTIIILGLIYNSNGLKYYVRKIPFAKIFFVGIIWGLINGWLIFPMMHWKYFGITALYISALIIPFDIRDMKNDTVLTFPKFLGSNKSKSIAYSLMIISILLSYFHLSLEGLIAILCAIFVSFILIFFTTEWRKELYFSLGLESCCGLPFLFFILLKYF